MNIPLWNAIPHDVQVLIGALVIVTLLSLIPATQNYAIWAAIAIMAVWIANWQNA